MTFLLQGVDAVQSFFSPFNDLITYIVPKIGPAFSEARKIDKKNAPDLDPLFPKGDRQNFRNQIDFLTRAMDFKRKIIPYCTLSPEFGHYGGRWSLTAPIIRIPYIHLRRNEKYGVFGKEKNSEDLKKETWLFTDLETRFLLLRELALIKQNDSFLKTAARVGMFVSILLFMQVPSLGLIVSLPLFAFTISFYFISERITQGKIDDQAIEFLKKIKKPDQVYEAALNCLKKLKRQNIYKRNTIRLGYFWFTEKGNERFNFRAPSLTSRIERIEKKWKEEMQTFECISVYSDKTKLKGLGTQAILHCRGK